MRSSQRDPPSPRFGGLACEGYIRQIQYSATSANPTTAIVITLITTTCHGWAEAISFTADTMVTMMKNERCRCEVTAAQATCEPPRHLRCRMQPVSSDCGSFDWITCSHGGDDREAYASEYSQKRAAIGLLTAGGAYVELVLHEFASLVGRAAAGPVAHGAH
jgi:hypothetical protein